MTLSKADKIKLKEIADKHEIEFEEAEEIISSMYSFIREKSKELDFGTNLTEEEFGKLKTNFNIPCIAKLYASYSAYKKINKL